MNSVEYGKTGYLKIISMEGLICCRKTEEEIPVEDCEKCEYFNGHRAKNRYATTPSIFCIYESDEEKRYEEALRNMKCPTCDSVLVDNTIKQGSHKGHGNIYCPKCQKNLIWI